MIRREVVATTLNHYRLTKPLGSGGMGEVYLAEDTRLKRAVAIKILPAVFAADPARLERFEREAQAVAALNHPNIVTVYSVEQSGEVHFITMELVDGPTLASLIPRNGMPLAKLLGIATELVDAVIAAHGRGIVHRDLKPANVMVTADDRVKVLDFGLAKLRESTDDVAAALPTRELTGEGKIVGTVAYMSPEQAEGKAVDERSDIFSLGVILYELATGTRPFTGDTTLSVLSSILRDTPKNVTEVNAALPRDLSRIVRHCLAKDPNRRYQSTKDVRNDLDDLVQSLSSGELDAAPAPGSAKRAIWPRLLGGAAAVGVLAVGILAVTRWSNTPDAGPALPTMSHNRLTQKDGVERNPSMSPDGKWVVYAADGDIYLQSVTGQTAINLTKDSPANDNHPAFSPDGETIAFRSSRDGGGIFVMGRTGESVRRLTTTGFDPTWFPDGQSIVYAGESFNGPENRLAFSELWVVSVAGGEARRLYGGDAVQPSVSPNGKRVAFWALPSDAATRRLTRAGVISNRDIWTIDVNGTDPVPVTTHHANDWNPVWAPDGRWLYFLSNRSGSMNLWRVAIDEASGAVAGDPQPLTAPASYVADFTLSADGQVAAYASIVATRNIARVGFDPVAGKAREPVAAVTAGPNDFASVDVTPDGSFVATSSSERGQEDVYVIPATGGSPRQLTNDFARDRFPRWSNEGRQLLFYSDRQGYQLWRVDADGGGLRQITDSPEMNLQHPVPSRDGTRVAAHDNIARQLLIYSAGDFSQPPERLPPVPDAVAPQARDWSPDGQRLAIMTGPRVWIYSFDTHTYRQVASSNGGGLLSFVDNDRVLYASADALLVVDLRTGLSSEALRLPGEVLASPRLTRDGSQVFFTRGTTTGDIWLVRFGDK